MNLDPRYQWFKMTLNPINGGNVVSYIFRGFTTSEKRRALAQKNVILSDLHLLKSCVVDFNPSTTEQSVAEKLLLEIYRVSGWTDEALPYIGAQAWLKDEDGIIEGVAIAMVAGLNFQILDHADPYDRARYMALGLWMFQSLYGLSIQDLMGGNEKAQDARGPSVEELARIAQQGAERQKAQEIRMDRARDTDSYQYKKPKNSKIILPSELPAEWQRPEKS